MERRRIYYSGQVQGVGFRFTAVRVAARFEVTGFARNLPDGRVELIAEGSESELEGFQLALADTMSDCIRQTEVHNEPATGEFPQFGIRY